MSYDYSNQGSRNFRSPQHGPRRNDRRFYDDRRRSPKDDRRRDSRSPPYSDKQDNRQKRGEPSNKRTSADNFQMTAHLPYKKPYKQDQFYSDSFNYPVEDNYRTVKERLSWEAPSYGNKANNFGNRSVQILSNDRGKYSITNKNQPRVNQRVDIALTAKNSKTNEGFLKHLENERIINSNSGIVSNIQNGNVELYQSSAMNLTSLPSGSSVIGKVINRRQSTNSSSGDSDTTVRNVHQRLGPKIKTEPLPSSPASPDQNTSLIHEKRFLPEFDQVSTSSNSGRNSEVHFPQSVPHTSSSTVPTMHSLVSQDLLSHVINSSILNQPNNQNMIQEVQRNKPLNIPEQHDNVTSSESALQTSKNDSVEISQPYLTNIELIPLPQSTAHFSPAKPPSPVTQSIASPIKPTQSCPIVKKKPIVRKKINKPKLTSKVIPFKEKGTFRSGIKVASKLNRKNLSQKVGVGKTLKGPKKIKQEDYKEQNSNTSETDANPSSFQKLLDAVVGQLVCQTCQSWMAPADVRCCLCRLLCRACATCTPGCLDCGKIAEPNDKVINFFSRIANVIPHPCPNKNNGCSVLVTPGDTHVGSCEFRSVRCFGCQEDVAMKQLPNHINSSHPTSKVLKEAKNGNVVPAHFIEHHSPSGQYNEWFIFYNKREHSFWIILSWDISSNVVSFRVDPVFIIDTKKVKVKFDFRFKNYSKSESCTIDKSGSASFVIDKDVVDDWFSGESTLDISVTGRTITEK